MSHSASLSHEQQFLQVTNKDSANPKGNSLTKTGEPAFVENILFNNVRPLFYKTRVHLSFSLADEFKAYFGLIRGLIEFHRTKDFSFEYQFTSRTIETDIEGSRLGDLRSFFDQVANLLTREIRFKASLRAILEFENRYRAASAELYSSLRETR